MKKLKYETWRTSSSGDYAVVAYDHKLALKLNNYLGRVYEGLLEGEEPVFFLPAAKVAVVVRLYLKQGLTTETEAADD